MAAPNLPVLVYDGDCGFCTRSALWIGRRLPAGVAVEPSQSLDLRSLGLLPTEVADAAWWVGTDGTRRGGARAITASLRAAGGAWRIVGALLDVPPVSWVSAAVYRVVARYRHKLPGSTDACAVR